MASYAIVESGTVTNIIEWDGSSSHPDSSKFVLADSTNAKIGATHDGSTFSYTEPADSSTYAQKPCRGLSFSGRLYGSIHRKRNR